MFLHEEVFKTASRPSLTLDLSLEGFFLGQMSGSTGALHWCEFDATIEITN